MNLNGSKNIQDNSSVYLQLSAGWRPFFDASSLLYKLLCLSVVPSITKKKVLKNVKCEKSKKTSKDIHNIKKCQKRTHVREDVVRHVVHAHNLTVCVVLSTQFIPRTFNAKSGVFVCKKRVERVHLYKIWYRLTHRLSHTSKDLWSTVNPLPSAWIYVLKESGKR